ncbi:MAG: ubiquinol-cytochrome C chaperone family protein [Pseudomonadota bacterium]
MSLFRKISSLFLPQPPTHKMAEDLYWKIVDKARHKALYIDFGIKDTVDGRFDSVMLHIFPLLRFLQRNNENSLATEILNVMISDMDRSLRQSGVGDPSIARKMRKIGEAYMGRAEAYQKAFDALPERKLLEDALFRNVYRSDDALKENICLLTEYMISYYQGYENYSLGDMLPCVDPVHVMEKQNVD